MDMGRFGFNAFCVNYQRFFTFKPRYKCSHYRTIQTGNQLTDSSRQEQIMNVFDRRAKKLQRNRAALNEDMRIYEYLREEVGYRVADRVNDIKRKFGVIVDLGSGRGYVGKHLTKDTVDLLYQCEISDVMLEQSFDSEVTTIKLLADEEFPPFRDNSLDLVLSSLSMHWVNDLPGCFRQIFNALKNDGPFICAMFGGETLHELRVSLQLAELEREGGFAPHISPFTEVQDLGNLLSRSGFTMLTVDIDEFKINYPSMFEVMFDLKGMAENNASWTRKPHINRDTLIAASSIYKEMFGNEDGSVPATFQILYTIGWKPDKSQPKPAKRGSATVSLKDLEKLDKP